MSVSSAIDKNTECSRKELLFEIGFVEREKERVVHPFFGDGRRTAVSGEDVGVSVEAHNAGEYAFHKGVVAAAREVAAADAAGEERVAAEKDFP